MFRSAGAPSLASSSAMLELPHGPSEGQSNGGVVALRPNVMRGDVPRTLAAGPCIAEHAESAAVAGGIAPSSAVLSDLRRQRDVLRAQLRQAQAVFAARSDASNAPNGTCGLLGGEAPGGADVLAAAIAVLSAAGPSSRALARLQELRDALADLVDEAKARLCDDVELR